MAWRLFDVAHVRLIPIRSVAKDRFALLRRRCDPSFAQTSGYAKHRNPKVHESMDLKACQNGTFL